MRIKKADKIAMLIASIVANSKQFERDAMGRKDISASKVSYAMRELSRLTNRGDRELQEDIIGPGIELKFTRTGKPKWPKEVREES